jgi:hypothetical protein
MAENIKYSNNYGPVAYQARLIAGSDGTHAPEVALGGNISNKLRDAGESYPNPRFWTEVEKSEGDFIVSRGNTGGAGWIEVSKSPFGVGSQTILRIAEPISMPARISLMTSMSHRNAGQQLASFEMISDDVAAGLEPVPEPIPLEILNASQTTTTITVNLAADPAQQLRVGQVVSVYGFVDTRLNVNSATVATVVSPTQITLVGNGYAFTSTSIGSTLGGGTAFIERYDILGRSRNGFAMVHDGTATQKRFYVRSQGSPARPSGTLAGAHNVTTGTDVATAAATGYDTAAWVPPIESIIDVSRNGVFFSDRAPDANAALSSRFPLSQVVPNPDRLYWLQFRVRSVPSMTRPVAKIVSVSKAGSTTATVTTDGPHGLTTGQYVGGYGVRDQTNFANLTTGAICTVTGANTFTVVWGSSVTATSYGGYIFRQQGQQPVGGAITQVAQTVARTNNIVTLVGNATWAAPTVVGNIIELIGVRDGSTGADLGVDGAYEVINLATTTLTLRPAVDGEGVLQAPTGPDIVTTNCGGGVVQRLAFRIHSATVVDYEPLLTESASKGVTLAGESSGTQTVTGAVTLTSTTVAGTVAVDAAIGAPVTMGLRASNANIAAMSATGDNVAAMGTMIGVAVTKPYAIPEAEWSFTGALTTTSDVAVQTAAGAGLKRHVTWVQATNTGVAAVDVLLRDGTTTRLQITIPAGQSETFPLPTGIPLTANTALNVQLSAAGTVRFNALGYTAP